MFKKVRISILFGLLCVGCDVAGKQQQAEDARRDATAAELRELGEAMHESQNKDSSPAAAPNDAQQGTHDSKGHESVPPTTVNSSNAIEGRVTSPGPTE